jgi:hypothetical protein
MKIFFLFQCLLYGIMGFSLPLCGQIKSSIIVTKHPDSVKPLDDILLTCLSGDFVILKDSKGRQYFRSGAGPYIRTKIAGAAGMHTAVLFDKNGKLLDSTQFRVKAETLIGDGGKAGDMFRLFHDGMLVYDPDGVEEVSWNGKTYRYFVNWVLDNNNTMKGMQYFSPYSRDLTDLLRENQQSDGMIWSFVQPDRDDYHYYETAYTYLGYFNRSKGAWFVRQPAENHVEYNYVNMIYQHWKASADNAWMKMNLNCAMRALDYCITDTLKWSKRYQLLKRPYCIDSWDFQVDDEYTPEAPLSPTMVVVPGKTKFGIFFGDNTGYYEACNQLAEMLEFCEEKEQGQKYRDRAKEILERIIALSWNGKYFTHFIDEDPSVKRNLGVDEKSQIAQGNMYSANRGLSHDMIVAIINTYLDLKNHLPSGSPGEWYAIYPPFERGFGTHNSKWQYMNGGVAGHAAGELARSAYENGYEEYASEILNKLLTLGKENGNRVWFAYTGSIPPAPPPSRFKVVDISAQANMDLWDQGGKSVFKWMNADRPGNDMRGLPTGEQTFKNIRFNLLDPTSNNRKAVIGLSYAKGFPRSVAVPVNDSAPAVYLLHSSSDNIPSAFAGAISFHYTDGTEISRNIVKFKDVTNWWFPSLDNERAGVAWAGPNPVSTRVGVCWVAIDNPNPEKKIEKLIFHAPIEGGIYAILGISLADRTHYIRPKTESFGGPDNWAAANAMAALVEGLAGVKNDGLAYDSVTLSPRWTTAGIDSVDVCICLAASKGYIAYKYIHRPEMKKIEMDITGSGEKVHCRILLPAGQHIRSAMINDHQIPVDIESVENSDYAGFELKLPGIQHAVFDYQ